MAILNMENSHCKLHATYIKFRSLWHYRHSRYTYVKGAISSANLKWMHVFGTTMTNGLVMLLKGLKIGPSFCDKIPKTSDLPGAPPPGPPPGALPLNPTRGPKAGPWTPRR